MAKPLIFNREANKILEFLMAYKLYIKIRMRDILVEKQIQWILLYIQRVLVNIWKENILKDLESKSLECVIVGKFLMDLKKKFSSRDNKTIKVAELKKVKQESRTIKEFVQKFRRVARESKYKERLLIKEFKRRMNRVIQRKLMEAKHSSRNIEQQYKKVINLDRH